MSDYSSPPAPEEAPVVKFEPSLARVYRFIIESAIVFGVSLLLLLVLSLIFHSWENLLLLEPLYGGTLTGLVFLSPSFIALFAPRIPSLRRLEQKRQRAARGDKTLLAAMQPPPDEHALNLPFTLSMRYLRSVLLGGMIAYLFPLAVTIGGFFFWGLFAPFTTFLQPIFAIGAIFVLIRAGFLFVLLIRGRPKNQLTLTQDEIIVSRKYRVAWKDARLFAIDNAVSGPFTSSYPLFFEVASADSLVRFTWLQPKPAKIIMLQPTTSYEEYERSMYAILSVIAAKTGLPLYDLRKP